MRGVELRPCLLLLAVLTACSRETPPEPGPPRTEGGTTAAQERVHFFETLRAAENAERDGQQERAEELYRRALELRPGHEPAMLALAGLHQSRGDARGALALLDELRRLKPELHRTASLMAAILSDVSPAAGPDLERAAALQAEACARNPGDSGPWLRLGRVHHLLGRFQEAHQAYDTVLGTHRDSLQALLGVASLHLAAGRPEDAVAPLLRALEAGTAARGRQDVPSEMDTAESFRAREATGPHNIAALVALARAARALGGYREEVPAAFRLEDLGRLGPVDPEAVQMIPVAAQGWPAVADLDSDGREEVVLPAAAGEKEPILLSWSGQSVVVTPLRGLSPGGSAALADLNGDGRPELVLGSGFPGESEPVRVIQDWLPWEQRESSSKILPLRGRVLGALPADSGRTGVLVSGSTRTSGPGLHLLVALRPGGEPEIQLLAAGTTIAWAALPEALLLLDSRGQVVVQRHRGGALAAPQGEPLCDVGPGATSLCLAEVTGDGELDLLIGVATSAAQALQGLIGLSPEGAPAPLLLLRGLGGARFASPPQPLSSDLPPMQLRHLLAWRRPASPETFLVAASGAEEPGTFAPSVLLRPGASGYQAHRLPSPSALEERALAALAPGGWDDRLLLLRGGLLPGNALPAVLVPLSP